MKSNLAAGLSDDDKKEMEREFASCHRLRKQIIKVLEANEKSLVSQMVSSEEVDGFNWQLSQVQKISEIRSNRKLIGLLS